MPANLEPQKKTLNALETVPSAATFCFIARRGAGRKKYAIAIYKNLPDVFMLSPRILNPVNHVVAATSPKDSNNQPTNVDEPKNQQRDDINYAKHLSHAARDVFT